MPKRPDNEQPAQSRDELLARMLEEHLAVGPQKPLSYLPLRTVQTVLGLTIETYIALATARGHAAVILGPEACCIASGAIYLFDAAALQHVLTRHAGLLRAQNYPDDTEDFIAALARDWLPDAHPLMPVIRAAFGERP